MPYISEGDLEDYILQDIDNSFSSSISDVILQVESYIEKYTNIDFENSASESRYFDTYGGDLLNIGDFQSVSEVLVLNPDGTTETTLTQDADFWRYPYNASQNNNIYDSLMIATGGKRGAWPCGNRRVKVTGIFGHQVPPKAIKNVALQLAAAIINEGLRGGKVSGEKLGSYSITYEKVDEYAEAMGINDILDRFKPMTLL